MLDFDGDLRAGAVDALREEVSAVLTFARAGDSVLLRLESPGGVVHGYGLAAAQLERLRSRDLHLVVCVDKVAASGGYMMACVANEVIAAPFAVLGSVGVLAQLPNLNRLRLIAHAHVYTPALDFGQAPTCGSECAGGGTRAAGASC